MKLQVRIGRHAESADVELEDARNQPALVQNTLDELVKKCFLEHREAMLSDLDVDD